MSLPPVFRRHVQQPVLGLLIAACRSLSGRCGPAGPAEVNAEQDATAAPPATGRGKVANSGVGPPVAGRINRPCVQCVSSRQCASQARARGRQGGVGVSFITSVGPDLGQAQFADPRTKTRTHFGLADAGVGNPFIPPRNMPLNNQFRRVIGCWALFGWPPCAKVAAPE